MLGNKKIVSAMLVLLIGIMFLMPLNSINGGLVNTATATGGHDDGNIKGGGGLSSMVSVQVLNQRSQTVTSYSDIKYVGYDNDAEYNIMITNTGDITMEEGYIIPEQELMVRFGEYYYYSVWTEIQKSANDFQKEKEKPDHRITPEVDYLTDNPIGVNQELIEPLTFWEVKLESELELIIGDFEPDETINYTLTVTNLKYPPYMKICMVRIFVIIQHVQDGVIVDEDDTNQKTTATKCKVLQPHDSLIGGYDTVDLHYDENLNQLDLRGWETGIKSYDILDDTCKIDLLSMRFDSVFDYDFGYSDYQMYLNSSHSNITYTFLRNKINEKITVYDSSFFNKHQMYKYEFGLSNLNTDFTSIAGVYRFFNKDIEFDLHDSIVMDSSFEPKMQTWDYNVTLTVDGNYIFQLNVNKTWLNTATYPIVIDPDITIIKDIYPVLQNPSFEKTDFTDWTSVGQAIISYGDTPDGDYYARTYALGNSVNNGKFYSGLVLKNQYFRYWHKGATIYSPSYLKIKGYDLGRNYMETQEFNLATDSSWVLHEYDLEKHFTNWNNTEYLSFEIFTYFVIGSSVSHYFDGFYLGDYHNTTNMLTLNYVDAQTIQNQDSDIVSMWITNSYGEPLNDLVVNLENYPLQSVSVDTVKVSAENGVYHLGYFGAGESKYIELGFSTPSTVGLFTAAVSFMGYDEYSRVVATETFDVEFSNIRIMFTALPNMDSFMQGEKTQITITNNMDRDTWIRYELRHEGELIYQTPENLIFEIGDTTIFNYTLLNTGTYIFDYTIYFYDLEIQREIHLQKEIIVESAADTYIEKQTTYDEIIWDVEGNTTMDFPVILNNTGDEDIIVYVVITHPNGTITVDKKTVWNGKYTYYYPIQILSEGYDNTTFNVKVYRMIYETPSYANESINFTKPDFVFGDTVNLTELYNITGSNVFATESSNTTYVVNEGSEPVSYIGGIIAGITEEYPYLIPLIIAVILLSFVAVAFGSIRIKRKRGGRR